MTKVIKPIHPFPARMAPQLAIGAISRLPKDSILLDPMCGSGTVPRHGSEFGHRVIAFDSDPLAVLMTQVWTTPISARRVMDLCEKVLGKCRALKQPPHPRWMDDETILFTEYWFGKAQRNDLRRLAVTLNQWNSRKLSTDDRRSLNVLRLALSRIIVTKESGASLGRDISHSRPHKVHTRSSYQIFPNFKKNVARICSQLVAQAPPAGRVRARLGDARALNSVANDSVDMVLTSPPYLNAIDYLRGHRLSLVWLGYALSYLRDIRSDNIGSERGISESNVELPIALRAIENIDSLSSRHKSMVTRYAKDVCAFMAEIARVLKPNGEAILVVGNSCLKGRFIKNANVVIAAARLNGLKVLRQCERKLPQNSRYLPIPIAKNAPLGRRMRTESLVSFKFS